MSASKQASSATRIAVEDTPAAPGPTIPPAEWGTVFLLARIFYAMRARTEDALKPHGLTPMQFTIMDCLERWKGLSSAELSRRFNVTPQTMGEMIANLERRGLVARKQNPRNRRALKLDLTAEGRKLLRQSASQVGKVEQAMFSGLSPAQTDQLRESLVALHSELWTRPD